MEANNGWRTWRIDLVTLSGWMIVHLSLRTNRREVSCPLEGPNPEWISICRISNKLLKIILFFGIEFRNLQISNNLFRSNEISIHLHVSSMDVGHFRSILASFQLSTSLFKGLPGYLLLLIFSFLYFIYGIYLYLWKFIILHSVYIVFLFVLYKSIFSKAEVGFSPFKTLMFICNLSNYNLNVSSWIPSLLLLFLIGFQLQQPNILNH